eukprot:COSAG02_NODE_2062_length_9971_cov_5.016106_7_plen_249_part_00
MERRGGDTDTYYTAVFIALGRTLAATMTDVHASTVSDLSSLNVGELRKLASAEGAPEEHVDAARDSFAPKDALIELIEVRRRQTQEAARAVARAEAAAERTAEEAAAEQTAASTESDLSSLNVGELRKLASAEGAPEEHVDAARDSFAPKDALIELIEVRRRQTLEDRAVASVNGYSAPGTPLFRMDISPAQAQVQHAPSEVLPRSAPTTTATIIENGLALGNLQRPLTGVWYDISATNIRNAELKSG